jgi:alpha-tubulin suppressor-like RCC1 family protein
MSSFKTVDGDDFDRIYMTTTEFVDQFVGEQLWNWGNNDNGHLGDNTAVANRSSPVTTIGGGTNWKQVSSGNYHTAAIKTNGTLWTWGYNNGYSHLGGNGQLGDGTIVNKSSPVTTAGGGTNWKQVSAGYFYNAAIKTDGTLWTWGYNTSGQLGNGTIVSAISPVTTIAGGTNWKQVACCQAHTAAIKTDGTLWSWGLNNWGQLGTDTYTNTSSPVMTIIGGTDWKQVACGDAHTIAIKTDGSLWGTGAGISGQLGFPTYGYKRMALPTNLPGPWKQITASGSISAGIKTDGTLWTWGYNNFGQLGDNTTANKNSPVTTAGGGTNWKQVSASPFSISAIKTDGSLWTWGSNGNGQLGDGTIVNKSSPVTTVAGGTNWKQVTSGTYYTAAIGY